MLIPGITHLGSSKKMLTVYLCHCGFLRVGGSQKWFKHMVSETLWGPYLNISFAVEEGLGNKQIPAHLPPRHSFPCLCLMGYGSCHRSCSFLFAGSWGLKVLLPCVLTWAACLYSQLHPSPSSRMISSYLGLSVMFFPPISRIGDSFSLLSVIQIFAQFIFIIQKELCSLISSSGSRNIIACNHFLFGRILIPYNKQAGFLESMIIQLVKMWNNFLGCLNLWCVIQV